MVAPDFQLHKLGWHNFQEFCGVVLREVLGQSLVIFADSNDAGRDGAYYGPWKETIDGAIGIPDGPTVVQCKFSAQQDTTLSLSNLTGELDKIQGLVTRGICRNYVVATNCRVTGNSEEKIRAAIRERGVEYPVILDGGWFNARIAGSANLRSYVPRVYGLGDLSQILDERAYRQAEAVLDYLSDDLSTFVVTEAYNRSVNAVSQYGFLLLLGEPGVGKSIIAATLSMAAADNWDCTPLKLENASQFVDRWNPNENQLIWIDDAFGAIRHERHLTQAWAAALPKVMAAIRKKTRVVLTSRDYIYNEARAFLKGSAYPLLREGTVVVDVGRLTAEEREKIVYNHIRLGNQTQAVRTALKPHLATVAAMEPFRPEAVRRLGNSLFTRTLNITTTGLSEFAAKQKEYLADLFSELGEDHRAALALVYLRNPLPSPISTVEGVESLVNTLGSSQGKVAEALEYLTPSFLRHGKIPDTSWVEVGWEFRHPTLREGFAAYISTHPNLLEIYIAGLSNDQLMLAVDCDLASQRGTLVSIPPSLYPVVADRLASIPNHASSRRSGRKNFFLANRTSKEFLEVYLEKDPSIVKSLVQVGSYLDAFSSPAVLARLKRVGLLEEGPRQTFVSIVSDLAIETPDATWLDDEDYEILISPEERGLILDRVRDELVPELDDVLSNWRLNEQDEIRGYYEPLESALKKYADVLADHPADSARLESAFAKAVEQRESAAAEQEEPESNSDSVRPTRVSTDSTTEYSRSLFDDVDE